MTEDRLRKKMWSGSSAGMCRAECARRGQQQHTLSYGEWQSPPPCFPLPSRPIFSSLFHHPLLHMRSDTPDFWRNLSIQSWHSALRITYTNVYAPIGERPSSGARRDRRGTLARSYVGVRASDRFSGYDNERSKKKHAYPPTEYSGDGTTASLSDYG